ncbi:MAG: hypothetical protein ACYC35_09880 [Pirellulales bacterium]
MDAVPSQGVLSRARAIGLGLLAGWAVLSAAPTVLRAEAEIPPEILRIRVGFANRYKVGCWTPVEVTLRGGSRMITGAVELEVPDGDGVPTRLTRPYQAIPGREEPVLFYAKFGRVDAAVNVAFHDEQGRTAARATFGAMLENDEKHIPTAMLTEQDLVVAVGSPIGVPPAENTVVAQLDGTRQLPTRWYGYEGVDTVVLVTSRPELYDKLAPAQAAALDQWVRLGGTLVLCAGSQAEAVLKKGPLASFVPGRYVDTVTVRQTAAAALETYSGSTVPIAKTGDGAGKPLEFRIARLAEVQGKTEAADGNTPLIVRSPRVFGEIVFVAWDLNGLPWSNWQGRPDLVNKLLGRAAPRTDQSQANSGAAAMQLGYDDLIGQLRGALDQFEGIRLVPFWFVAVLVCVYILFIGPGDYFFVKKILKRMELTWITFPVIVLVFSAGAYVLAYRLKGSDLRVNAVHLIDVDLESGTVRGTTWVNIFSPRPDSYNLSLQPKLPGGENPENPGVLISWMGLPGQGLGGMNAQGNNPGLWTRAYAFSPELNAMLGVPIQVWSTKSVTARWNSKVGTAPWRAALTAGDEQVLEGTLASALDFPLDDCLVVFDRWAYALGSVQPGQSVDLASLTNERLELRTRLSGPGVSGGAQPNSYVVGARYDAQGLDMMPILNRMMFFDAAGGRDATGLVNAYQHFVDLSGHLKTGRAILVGRGRRPGAELLRDGEPMGGNGLDRQWTVYRFVLPVNKRSEKN